MFGMINISETNITARYYDKLSQISAYFLINNYFDKTDIRRNTQ